MKGEREMFNGTNGYSLSDIAAVNGNNNDCFGGNNGVWWVIILFLFAFCGWGNGYGWGGNGAGQGPTSVYEGYVLSNDMNMLSRQLSDGFNSQERKLDSISNGVCSLGYDQLAQINGINTNIMTTGNAIQTQLADCCCKTQTNIGDVKYAIGTANADINYNLATQANGITNAMQTGFCQTNFNAQSNTRDIIDSHNAGTQAILARIDALESSRKDEKIAELTAQLNRANLAASQAAQNTYLLSELKPSPQPAYVVPNPYGCNCNYGNNYCG